ncbi:MAG: hypothetical protein L0Z55_09090 [Planctomycetes bacterium]|nr:hypothetical protein [Planctomycetota bacterium]
MFSKAEVRDAASEWICVKVDPRETRDAMEYKSTRYVPEIVLISSDGERIATLEPASPDHVASTLRSIASEQRSAEE